MKCPRCGTKYSGDICPACGGNKEKAKQVIESNYKRGNKRILLIAVVSIFVVVFVALLIKLHEVNRIDDTISALITISQEAVESKLKAPKTAEFPLGYDEYEIQQNGNTYTVSSYVDAENSFGAKIRNTFTVQFEYYSDSKRYKINDISIQ